MVSKHMSVGLVPSLAAFVAAGWLGACMPQPPDGGGTSAGTGGAGTSGATGGASGTGGSAGTGGGSGASSGTGGSPSGGGSGGSSGTGGSSPGTTNPDAGSGGAGGSADAGGDLPPTSPIPGYAFCVVCHGPEGAGTDKGPEIQHPVLDFSTWVVRNGRTHAGFKEPMPKFTAEQIPDAQLQGIFAFLAARPKPTTGAELYKDYCQNCHAADGKGGITMRDISTKTQANFLMDTRAGHHPGEFANRREYMPKWSAAELSDAEIRLIFMHVDGL